MTSLFIFILAVSKASKPLITCVASVQAVVLSTRGCKFGSGKFSRRNNIEQDSFGNTQGVKHGAQNSKW